MVLEGFKKKKEKKTKQKTNKPPKTRESEKPLNMRNVQGAKGGVLGGWGQVRIKLKHMEVEIRRRETTGQGSSARNESETLAKYEIMDGAPVRGENVPIRYAVGPSWFPS